MRRYDHESERATSLRADNATAIARNRIAGNMQNEIEITSDGETMRPDDDDPQNNLTATKRPRGRPRKDGKPAGSVPKKPKCTPEQLHEIRAKFARRSVELRIKNGNNNKGGGRPAHAEGKMPTQCMTVRQIDHDMIAKWAQVHNCAISAMVRKIVEFYYTHEGRDEIEKK